MKNQKWVSGALAACLLSAVAGPAAAGTAAAAGGELVGEVTALARNKGNGDITVSMKLTNTGKRTLYLMIAGEAPTVVDNEGGYATLYRATGLNVCPWLGNGDSLQRCLSNQAPLQTYTELDPHGSLVVQLVIGYSHVKGLVGGLSISFIYRAVTDPVADDALSDADKRKGLHLATLGFQGLPVNVSEN